MPKVSDKKIEEIIKALDNADKAINILERANQNSMLFTSTKTALQQLSIELKDRYVPKNIQIDE